MNFEHFLPPKSGLFVAEPIGKFLNNNLPNITPSQGGNPSWSIVPAFSNLTFVDPLVIEMHPDPAKNVMFVASRNGHIHHFIADESTTEKYEVADFRTMTAVVHDGGFLGLAFHPEFETNPNKNYVYAYYTVKGDDLEWGPDTPNPGCDGECFSCENDARFYGSYLRLARYTININNGRYILDPNSELRMINIVQYNATHRGGGLVFGDDGFLYLTIGDQARRIPAQKPEVLEGGVLRLDVDMDPTKSHPPTLTMGPRTMPRYNDQNQGAPPVNVTTDEITGVGYYIPNDNPQWYTNGTPYFEEFFTIGNRAPHRMTKDRLTGDLWIGEVGAGSREEINALQPELITGTSGGNYGWPKNEGFLKGQFGACGSNNLTLNLGTVYDPVVDFPRSGSLGANAIMGGYVYRGSLYADYLGGKYICGGYSQNRIFAISYKKDNNGKIVADFPNGGNYRDAIEVLTSYTPGRLITFGEDHQGELYMGGLGNNIPLYKLSASGIGEPAPTLLSETGAFKSLTTLEPADGVIPYEMVEPFWSDGAEKYRWVAIPNDGTPNTAAEQIQFSENGNWLFPAGSVMIKHFELGGKRLETRFEVKGDDGQFYYLTYKWNEDDTEATLLTGGLDEEITVDGQPQIWRYPSTSECLTCHQNAVGGALGLRTRYLNQEMTYPRTQIKANQLITLSHIGLIDQPIDESDTQRFLTLAAKDQLTAPLEYRARSYLDVNCSYCHQPATGNRANFDARITTALPKQNFINGAVMSSLGIEDARLIVPQVVNKSIVHYRINALGNHAMPPLAKNKVDEAGIQLIEEWINSLSPSTTPLPEDLIPVGSTITSGSGCVDLTQEEGGQAGAGWYPNTVDLSEDLTFTFDLSLGSNDGGADGVAFVFQRTGTNALGATGGGMGVTGINPVLFVEFDTWPNSGEPSSDHITIRSTTDLTTPVCMTNSCANTEDGNFHNVEIQWNATSKTLAVYFDNEFRTSYQGDIVQNIFSGNSDVYVGVTGGTGGAVNLQSVCNFTINNAISNTAPGLIANYYDGMDLMDEAFERIDENIDFNWGTGSPNASLVGNNQFSVRWMGFVTPTHSSGSETYTFYTNSDDGVRLFIDGNLIIDNWTDHAPTENTGTFTLNANQPVSITLEFYENGGGAVIELSWSSASNSKQIIPASRFYHVLEGGSSCGPNNNEAPVAIFNVSETINGYPFVASFDATPSYDPDLDQVTIDWEYGDGQTGTGINPTHTYNTPGNYTATMTITDDQGCTDQASLAIQIVDNQTPVAQATASAISGQAPFVVVFDGSTSYDPDGEPLTYQWDFGDCATREGPKATHTFNFAGTYQVILTVSDGTSEDTMILEIVVSPPLSDPGFAPVGNQLLQPTMISAKVLLQGPYQNGLMQTNLLTNGVLPLSQPYLVSNFAYAGNEFFESLDDIPANTVDWVLMKVIDSNNNTLAQRACLVRNDGTVTDLCGTPFVDFGITYLAKGKISIHHRNHLGVMTAEEVNLLVE